ncbi:MAG: AGE family epimerase/isomerase [Terrimicrobiaceae bacterium]
MNRKLLAETYRETLLDDVIPFWLKNGMDRRHGGLFSALDRDGTILDTDKSVWVQGRAAWMFATLYNTVERRPEWLAAAKSCIGFLRRHCFAPDGKMYFTVTREGKPLRMRRYVFSEAFAAIAFAAYAKATGDSQAADEARKCWETYLRYSFTPGVMTPKYTGTRPLVALAPRIISVVTAQELRANLGDESVNPVIDRSIGEIRRLFVKPRQRLVMEVVGEKGEIIDHFDGRTLIPGHAIEGAWFIMHEGRLRGDESMVRLGCQMLDWMWERGWDRKHGGILYFVDSSNKPVQEYYHDMKFWWPQNEAVIATLLAHRLTGLRKYASWHAKVHEWSFRHFADKKHGEWYGYLHRDGSVSVPLKGNLWKGPFHLPRMLWYCWRLCEEMPAKNQAPKQ